MTVILGLQKYWYVGYCRSVGYRPITLMILVCLPQQWRHITGEIIEKKYLIEKKNLLDTIWRGKHKGGSDETLQALVSKLRTALADNPQKPSFECQNSSRIP